MSEPEQCIICLDPLPRPSPVVDGSAAPDDATLTAAVADAVSEDNNYLDIVAALDGCEHIIHDSCIRSWAQKTNTCPICREPFHSVHRRERRTPRPRAAGRNRGLVPDRCRTWS